jgi:hypothetical protein
MYTCIYINISCLQMKGRKVEDVDEEAALDALAAKSLKER